MNLRAYWLLSNYAEMQRRIEKQSLMCDPAGSTDSSPVIAPQQMERHLFFPYSQVSNLFILSAAFIKIVKGLHTHPHTHTQAQSDLIQTFVCSIHSTCTSSHMHQFCTGIPLVGCRWSPRWRPHLPVALLGDVGVGINA